MDMRGQGPRIGVALCPCAVYHKYRLTLSVSYDVITSETYPALFMVITVEPKLNSAMSQKHLA